MELPQHRAFLPKDKKSTHEFFALCGDSSYRHQDPGSAPQGFHLKTHDFLGPLEKVGKRNVMGGSSEEATTAGKPCPIEHSLPGGIGTYSISHISAFSRGVVKAEKTISPTGEASTIESNRVDSRRLSHAEGLFSLWEKSAGMERTAGKDTLGGRSRELAEKLGQWPSERSPARKAQNGGSLSALSSSNQQQPQRGKQKVQGFVDMINSARSDILEEEDDDQEEFVKREGSSHKGGMGVKVDGKENEQKSATPRSKHSATEQRRRSKINDRFQILRELIPHGDQKRDKASFLMEVIDYVQFLQEKVHKYEIAFPGYNQESMKLTPWKQNRGPGEAMAENARVIRNGPGPGLMYQGKFDENSLAVAPAILTSTQNTLVPETGTSLPYTPMDHQTGLAVKSVPIPLQQQQQQQMFPTSVVRISSALAQPPQALMSDANHIVAQWQKRCTPGSDLTEQEELTIEGGTIRMSSVYSPGLLSSLTHALQSSGIDLSQANISIQIDIGKRAVRPATTATTCSAKDHEDPSSSNRAVAQSRVGSSGEDSDPPRKRLRVDNS